jgi:hypothetical protein
MQSIIGRRLNGATAPRPGPERERLCRPTESSRLADVERAVAAEFAELAAVSSSFKVSAGFPEEAYTACLDRLYERATDIYKRHGESHGLMPLPVPDDCADAAKGEVFIPAAMWHSYDRDLAMEMYQTLCAAGFAACDAGRESEEAEAVRALAARVRESLGLTEEEGELGLAQLYCPRPPGAVKRP